MERVYLYVKVVFLQTFRAFVTGCNSSCINVKKKKSYGINKFSIHLLCFEILLCICFNDHSSVGYSCDISTSRKICATHSASVS